MGMKSPKNHFDEIRTKRNWRYQNKTKKYEKYEMYEIESKKIEKISILNSLIIIEITIFGFTLTKM